MIATISNPGFADSIISRYTGGQPGGYHSADMVLALSPRMSEQASPFMRSIRNITLINRCINENLTVNLNAHLGFLSNILYKTVLEMRESQARRAMMLQKQPPAPLGERTSPAPGQTNFSAGADVVSRVAPSLPGHIPARMLAVQPPVPQGQPHTVQDQPPVVRQHPLRDEPEPQRPVAGQPQPSAAQRDTRQSAERLSSKLPSQPADQGSGREPPRPAEHRRYLANTASERTLLALMRAEQGISVRSLLEIPGESGFEFLQDRSHLYEVNTESRIRAEFRDRPLIQRLLPPPADVLPPNAIRPAPQTAASRQRTTGAETAQQPARAQAATRLGHMPATPYTHAAEPLPAAERVLPQPTTSRMDAAQAKMERGNSQPVWFNAAMLRRITTRLSDRPAGFESALRITYRDLPLSEAAASDLARSADLTAAAGMPRAPALRRSAHRRHADRAQIQPQAELAAQGVGVPSQDAPFLLQTVQLANSLALSRDGMAAGRTAMAATEAAFIYTNSGFAPDGSVTGLAPTRNSPVTREAHPPAARREPARLTGMTAMGLSAAERQFARTDPGAVRLVAQPDTPQSARERVVFRDRRAQNAEAATIIYKKEPTLEPQQSATQAEGSDIEFIKKTVKRSSKSLTVNKAINLPGTTIKPQPAAAANVEQQVSEIADKVYRTLERRLRSEHMRKGLL